jgi:uncharacterized protein YndB with AHSA1/START domain
VTYKTSMVLAAEPERVFEHFVKPELLVRWMGEYARLVAVEGGEFSVDIDGVLIRGHYVRLEPPELLEVAWGEADNALMPPGSTRLLVRLERLEGGTRLHLEHSGLLLAEAAKHAAGWPQFLDRLAVVVSGGEPGPYPWKT